MSYRISLLDKIPVAQDDTPAEALKHTLHLAQQAETWGYHRFWIAEHHNTSPAGKPFAGIAYCMDHRANKSYSCRFRRGDVATLQPV